MRRFLLLLGVAPLFGCNLVFWDEPECEDEEFTPLPLCSDEVEAVIRSLPTDEWARMEPPIAHARGDHRGDVVEVRDALVVVDLLGERRTLHWPEPLPFAMEPGEEFVARIGGNSVTLYFSKGSLAFHMEEVIVPLQGGMELGALQAWWEPRCEASIGAAMYLVVEGTAVAPGETARIGEWSVTNHGAVVHPDMVGGCSALGAAPMVPHRGGAWTAHSTEVQFECTSPPPPDLVCSEETIAAHERGREFARSLGTVEDGTYEVVAVHSNSFLVWVPGSDAIPVINWPYELPFEIAEGEEVSIDHSQGWRVFTFPSGQLAFAIAHHAFAFEPPPVAPDGSARIEGFAACALDAERTAMGLAIGDGGDEAAILPGESAKVGDWTYHHLFGWKAGPVECRMGHEVFLIGEGIGEGAIAAHRIFPTDE